MSKIHVKTQQPFTIIPNVIAQSTELSAAAKGIILYLVSRGNNWVARVTDIRKVHNLGKTAWQTIARELVTCGVLIYNKTKNGTQLVLDIWEYAERLANSAKAKNKGEKTLINQPQAENPPVGFQPLYKKTLYKKTNSNRDSLEYIDRGSGNEQTAAAAKKEIPKIERAEVNELAKTAGIQEEDVKKLHTQYGTVELIAALKFVIGKSQRVVIENPAGYLRVALARGYAKEQIARTKIKETVQPTSRANQLYDESEQQKYNQEIEKLGDPNHWMDRLVNEHIKKMKVNA